MKSRTILLFVISLFFSSAMAQYEPMAVEGAHWIIFNKDDDGSYHHMLKVEGDTLVSGILYKKLYRREIQSDANSVQEFLPPHYYVGAASLVGLIRDDVSSKAVNGIYLATPLGECNFNQEELLYNFSVPVGSNVEGCLNQSQGIPFAEIDSLKSEFMWGKNRVVQYISTGYRFIEAIGGNLGPFSTSSYTVPGYEAEIVDYCIGSDFECGLEPLGVDEAFIVRPTIYPNPTSKFVKIEFDVQYKGDIHLRLLDVTGRIINELTIDGIASQVISIPVDNSASGMYFLNIQTENHSASYKIQIR